ncbi:MULTISPECIES: CrcB family protein [unclassified Ornithinimicrobium]|uniref:CrcB family protein n=1 Tax=unclassified Ornithinimicrobium TaxID=2615080 RepID=UPI003851BD04
MPWAWAVLAVAVGGSTGAVVRHLLSVSGWGSLRGVLVANTVGSAALGVLVALEPAPVVLLLLGTGLCGALTTWSTLAVQTAELGRHSRSRAAAYLALTLVLGVGSALAVLALLD